MIDENINLIMPLTTITQVAHQHTNCIKVPVLKAAKQLKLDLQIEEYLNLQICKTEQNVFHHAAYLKIKSIKNIEYSF